MRFDEITNEEQFQSYITAQRKASANKAVEAKEKVIAEVQERLNEQEKALQARVSELEKLAADREAIEANAANLEKELRATKVKNLELQTRSLVRSALSKHTKNDTTVLTAYVANQVQYAEDGTLKVGDLSLDDHIKTMIDAPETAFLFGTGASKAPDVGKPTAPQNKQKLEDALKESGFSL